MYLFVAGTMFIFTACNCGAGDAAATDSGNGYAGSNRRCHHFRGSAGLPFPAGGNPGTSGNRTRRMARGGAV